MSREKPAQSKPEWFKAAVYALPACLIILSLFYYWFVMADRYEVFLYFHNMGPRVPDTSPFSSVTSSRYWMSGMVASGFVLLIYFPLNFILFRTKTNYSPPDWKKVLLFSLPVLTAGTLIITMTMNEPVLPFLHGTKVLFATLPGFAVVVKASELAGKKVPKLILYGTDGFAIGLMFIIFSGWLSNSDHHSAWRVTIFLTSYALCFMILAITSVFYIRKRIKSFSSEIFIFSMAIAYPFGTVFHYLAGTDGHYYISNSDNFFTRNMWMQLLIWLIGYLIIMGIVKLRNNKIARKKFSL